MPSCRRWKSGRATWTPNRSPQNRPPTWCPGNPLVLASGTLSERRLRFTGLCTPPRSGGALPMTEGFYREDPTRDVHVSGADTRGVLSMALSHSGTFEAKADHWVTEAKGWVSFACILGRTARA